MMGDKRVENVELETRRAIRDLADFYSEKWQKDRAARENGEQIGLSWR